MRPLEGRRPDQERPRADGDGRHHGRRRDAAADPARHPRGRAQADLGHDHRHRRERQRADRDATRTCSSGCSSRVDHIAANVEGVTTAEAGDVKESIKNVREITESIKTLIGTTQGQVAETGDDGARVDRQAAVDAQQPRQDDEEHRDGHRADSRRGRGRSGDSSTTTPSRATSRTSPRTPAASSAASPSCRPSSGCAPSTTSSPARSRTTSRSQLHAPAGQVLSDRAGRGSARLLARPILDRRPTARPTASSARPRTTTTEQLRFTLQFGKRVASGARSAAASASRSRPAASAATSTCSTTARAVGRRLRRQHESQYPRVKAALAVRGLEAEPVPGGGRRRSAQLPPARGPGPAAASTGSWGRSSRFNDEDLQVAAAVRRRRRGRRRLASEATK